MDQESSLSVSGWGARLTATGSLVVILIVLVAGFSSLGIITYRGFLMMSATITRMNELHVEANLDRTREHDKLQGMQNELACILAMDVGDRLESLRDPQGICHYARTIYALSPGFSRRPR